MPEVVSQVEALEAAGGNGAHKKRKGGKARNSNGAEPAPAPALKSWAVSSQLFPCQLSKRATELMQEVSLVCLLFERPAWQGLACGQLLLMPSTMLGDAVTMQGGSCELCSKCKERSHVAGSHVRSHIKIWHDGLYLYRQFWRHGKIGAAGHCQSWMQKTASQWLANEHPPQIL